MRRRHPTKLTACSGGFRFTRLASFLDLRRWGHAADALEASNFCQADLDGLCAALLPTLRSGCAPPAHWLASPSWRGQQLRTSNGRFTSDWVRQGEWYVATVLVDSSLELSSLLSCGEAATGRHRAVDSTFNLSFTVQQDAIALRFYASAAQLGDSLPPLSSALAAEVAAGLHIDTNGQLRPPRNSTTRFWADAALPRVHATVVENLIASGGSICARHFASASTLLRAGDCAVIALHIAPSDFGILLMATLTAGESIYASRGSLTPVTAVFTASRDMLAGTVLTLADFTGSLGSGSTSELFVYSGSAAASKCLCAARSTGQTGSSLPVGLIDGATAVVVAPGTEYVGPAEGSVAQLRTTIHRPAQWRRVAVVGTYVPRVFTVLPSAPRKMHIRVRRAFTSDALFAPPPYSAMAQRGIGSPVRRKLPWTLQAAPVYCSVRCPFGFELHKSASARSVRASLEDASLLRRNADAGRNESHASLISACLRWLLLDYASCGTVKMEADLALTRCIGASWAPLPPLCDYDDDSNACTRVPAPPSSAELSTEITSWWLRLLRALRLPPAETRRLGDALDCTTFADAQAAGCECLESAHSLTSPLDPQVHNSHTRTLPPAHGAPRLPVRNHSSHPSYASTHLPTAPPHFAPSYATHAQPVRMLTAPACPPGSISLSLMPACPPAHPLLSSSMMPCGAHSWMPTRWGASRRALGKWRIQWPIT